MITVKSVFNKPPFKFRLVNGIVYVYGGWFTVDGELLDLDNNDDIVFKCLDLNKYYLEFSDYPNVLCSRNLYIKKGGSV